MPREILLYSPSGVRSDKPTDFDICDNPPEQLGITSIPETAQPDHDSVRSSCKPSKDLLERMNRSSPTPHFPLIHLSRAHFCGIALGQYAFPGYARSEAILTRAFQRASLIFLDAETKLRDSDKELILMSLDFCYKRIKAAAEEVVLEQYISAAELPQDIAKLILKLLSDDNFVYRDFNKSELTRAGPFRHSAIAQVLGRALLGEDFSDLYLCRTYFHPIIPSNVILLICVALRAALDEYSTGHYSAREFSRDLYARPLLELSHRWSHLKPEYMLETQMHLSQTLALAMREKSLDLPAMLPPIYSRRVVFPADATLICKYTP